MVDGRSLDQVNEKLAASSLRIAVVPIGQCELLERNARFMRVKGQDDLAILRELYDEINDVAMKEYSGLDDRVLGQLNPPTLDPLSEKGLEYRIVSISFGARGGRAGGEGASEGADEGAGAGHGRCHLGRPLRRLRPLPRCPDRRQGLRRREERRPGVCDAAGCGEEALGGDRPERFVGRDYQAIR